MSLDQGINDYDLRCKGMDVFILFPYWISEINMKVWFILKFHRNLLWQQQLATWLQESVGNASAAAQLLNGAYLEAILLPLTSSTLTAFVFSYLFCPERSNCSSDTHGVELITSRASRKISATLWNSWEFCWKRSLFPCRNGDLGQWDVHQFQTVQR